MTIEERRKEKLKDLMGKRRLDVKRLAAKYGCSPAHIYGLLSGNRAIGKQTARKLAEVLGVDMSVIYDVDFTSGIEYVKHSEDADLAGLILCTNFTSYFPRVTRFLKAANEAAKVESKTAAAEILLQAIEVCAVEIEHLKKQAC